MDHLHTHIHHLAVVPPKRGEKVKRVSRMFQDKKKHSAAAPTRKTTPTHRLHPAIQSAIESFPFNELEHVVPTVKQTLPTNLGRIHSLFYHVPK